MANVKKCYADQVVNQSNVDIVGAAQAAAAAAQSDATQALSDAAAAAAAAGGVLADDASALVASDYQHRTRKVRTVDGSTVTTLYQRSCETAADTWTWVNIDSCSYQTA